ncbi:MAG: zinc transporter ZupT [Prevotellaceae bacterium]|jgi:ZIP family zinc transporter|nr:zinc transporter ZupT [Prevotellaceae bacterium]
MMNNNFLFALLLTMIAGLSTGIGSAIAFFARRTNTKLLSVALGFSAGVMIYVSFIEILPQAFLLSKNAAAGTSNVYVVLAFFVGIAIIFLIDALIPESENPHEMHNVEEMYNSNSLNESRLKRTGILMALAIAIHNFPEGIATFASAVVAPEIAIPITIAIAIHNIPEGIAVSVPIFYATGNRSKAFWLSFLSGMAEPLGGVLGFIFIMKYMNEFGLAMLMAAVAGIMVFISVDELLPGSEKYGHHHYSIGGFVAGMAVMAASLLLL